MASSCRWPSSSGRYIAGLAARRPHRPRGGARPRGAGDLARRGRRGASGRLARVPGRGRLGGRAGTRAARVRSRLGPRTAVGRAGRRRPVVVGRPHLRDPARHERSRRLVHRPAGARPVGAARRARGRRDPLRDHGPDRVAAVHGRARPVHGHALAGARAGSVAGPRDRLRPPRDEHECAPHAGGRPVRRPSTALRGGDRAPGRPEPARGVPLRPRGGRRASCPPSSTPAPGTSSPRTPASCAPATCWPPGERWRWAPS